MSYSNMQYTVNRLELGVSAYFLALQRHQQQTELCYPISILHPMTWVITHLIDQRFPESKQFAFALW